MIEYPNPLKDDYRVGRIVGTRTDSGSSNEMDRRSHLVTGSLDNGTRLNSGLSDVTKGDGSIISTLSGATTVDGKQSCSLDTETCMDSRDSDAAMCVVDGVKSCSLDTGGNDATVESSSSDADRNATDGAKKGSLDVRTCDGTMVSGGANVGHGAVVVRKSCSQDVRKQTGAGGSRSGLVRTVMVAYRKRDAREDPQEYKKKKLVVEEMAVQRLILLVPMDEQDQDE